MPNRILKESICTSENLDGLAPEAEILFYRLIVNCDDYGRMDARPAIIRARCFPLRTIKTPELVSWLAALVHQELVLLYEINHQPYLILSTWEKHQQVRAKRSKYPDPPDMSCINPQSSASICNQLITYVPVIQSNPIQSESNPNPIRLANAKKPFGEFRNVLLTDDEHTKLKEKLNSKCDVLIEKLSEYMKSKGKKYRDHYATLLSWDRREKETGGIHHDAGTQGRTGSYQSVPGNRPAGAFADLEES